MWMYISFIVFWLLCGSWGIRMEEKDTDKVIRGGVSIIMGSIGIFALLITFCEIWLPRFWRFAKGTREALEASLES